MDQLQKISLDLIDNPKIAMRSDFDDERLDELKRSMTEHGMIEPVVLRPVAGRYEVIAGHRRTRAARLLGWPTVDAKVIEADDSKTIALRLAENCDRADVNPVDEACFIGEVMLQHKLSAEQVSEMMKRSREWVNVRLAIFEMPDYMKNHLRLEKYPIGAALWLVQIRDEKTKVYYANFAAINGVSVNGAKSWYDATHAGDPEVLAKIREAQEQGEAPVVQKIYFECALCHKRSEADEVMPVQVCKNFICQSKEEKD